MDETLAGIKRQHNVFEQLGIDPQAAFGYRILEPLLELRKDGVRKVGRALGLPAELFGRIPFPGPALSARVIGEATPERIETVRRAFGQQIEVRCWDSLDARTATPTHLPFARLEKLAAEILREVQGVVSVTYHIAPKPPTTTEAV